MAIRQLRYYGDSILKKRAREVKVFDSFLKQIIEDMAETMYSAKGIGLAAPQIGISKRIIVVDIGEGLIEVVNPRIIKKDGSVVTQEGCLSIPNIYGDVERAEKVTVKGFDEKGKVLKIEAEGLLARVFQHEVDHLNGKLFIDIATNIREIKPETEQGTEDVQNLVA